jgi:hypothetical protein
VKRRQQFQDVKFQVSGQAESAIDTVLKPLKLAHDDVDRRWGAGRISSLVSPDLASRYGAAQARLREAIDGGDLASAEKMAASLIRGLSMMEESARAAGHKENPETVWSAACDGITFTVVYHESDMPKVIQSRSPDQVVTLKELLLAYNSVHGDVAPVKKAFPGAKVSAIRNTKKQRDDSIDYWGDEVP